jgi:hypothetical protein
MRTYFVNAVAVARNPEAFPNRRAPGKKSASLIEETFAKSKSAASLETGSFPGRKTAAASAID